MKYKVILNKKIWVLYLILISIIAISIRYVFLTDKFFLDSLGLLSLEKNFSLTGSVEPGTFGVTAMLFSYINFFDFKSLFEWSVFITIIFGIINFILLRKIYIIELKNFIIISIGIFLWYLFAAGITKEVVQTLFYFCIYFFIANNMFFKSVYSKVIVGIIILFISSICFREYYILTAFFSGIVYLIYHFIRKKHIEGLKGYIFSIIVFLIVLVVFLNIAKVIYFEGYSIIINLRSEGYQYLIELGTDSFINNIIEGNSIFIYILNYIINYFRLLLPVELLFGGKIYYIPFVIYQIAFTYYYIKNIFNLNKINREKFVCMIFLTSFIMVVTMMEPDFGSWVRHQSACYMLFINLLKN